MHTIRLAVPVDAATIARQRVKMFQDNGLTFAGVWEELERDSAHWTASKIREGSYVGWMVEEKANGPSGESAVMAVRAFGLWSGRRTSSIWNRCAVTS